jgi:hypothetical protein
MKNFNKITQELSERLSAIPYQGDLSDIGNEIGIVVAKYFDTENTKEDFFFGIEHGISLTDGTH